MIPTELHARRHQDITYLWAAEGWLCLAVVLDLYSRAVVGWSMAERITRNLVMAALTMAIVRRRSAPGLILPSDRGSPYAALDYQALLDQHDVLCSMSKREKVMTMPPWQPSSIP